MASYNSSDVAKAMANPGASGPGGIYNQIRASMGSGGSSSSGGGGAPAQSAPAVSAPASSSQYGAGQGYWTTSNGPRTVPQMAAELAAVGYNGPTDPGSVLSAYGRTTGTAVTADNTNNLPSGAGPLPGTITPAVQPPAVSSDQQAILDAFKASSGFSLQQLAEQKRQFDANLEWTKQMWANQGLPELQIKQQAQALAQQEFESQKSLAEANLALAQKAQAAQESQFGATTGLDYLKTAASLGGPADYFQQANFLRGASANPAVPTFLSALQNNTGLAAFNAPGAAANAPGVQSMAKLAGGLTGGGAPINQQDALSAIGAIGARGGQALAPQALEQLSPDEMALFQSGLKANGFSMPSFLQSYQQSRIGQGAAQAA